MEYGIRHITRFRYHAPVSETVMEIRLHPRTEGMQRCLGFDLRVEPEARRFEHQDYLGNIIHSFDIPVSHTELQITAEARVESAPLPALPSSLGPGAWARLDAEVAQGDFWEALSPSTLVSPTPRLRELAQAWDIRRRDDPLSLLREINTRIYRTFKYVPQSTSVDSAIDDALAIGQGVCQDFTHIMIALVRELRIPCRYVSGYLFHRVNASGRPDADRSDMDRSAEDAMHAWVEAYLPDLGWVGFDPTNNVLAGERHIRVAVGRDYADVPPTRGVFRGSGDSELCVAVQVYPAATPPPEACLICVHSWSRPAPPAPGQGQQQQ
jgi:transglutaminase-like putative cysteine protease